MEKNKGCELEKILIARMERSYEEGRSCAAVSDFFEEEDNAGRVPRFSGLSKRSSRVVLSNGGGVLGVPVPVGQDGNGDCFPPTANRGVTFHGDENPLPELVDCPRIMGGYDGGVEVGFGGTWDKTKFKEMCQILNEGKLAAQDRGNDEKFVVLAGKSCEVKPKSAGGGITYNFVFERGGIRFYIHSNPLGDIQPVRVRYNAESLIGRDLFFQHERVVAFLNELGFCVTEEKISRVDMQVMLERDISDFMRILQWRREEQKAARFVCTARKYSVHGETTEFSASTFTIGTSIELCIYDKRKELLDTNKKEPFKLVLMVRNCFGEDKFEAGVPFTRVEFRVKRDVLKDMGINTIQDLKEHERGLAYYLCHSWFRLLSEEKVKGHTHEQETDPLWQEVQNAFDQWFPGLDGHNKEVVREYVKPLRCTAVQLERQALGCLSRAASLGMSLSSDVQDSVQYAFRAIRENAGRLVQRTRENIQELAVRSGFIDDDVRNCFVVPDRLGFIKVPIVEGGLSEVV